MRIFFVVVFVVVVVVFVFVVVFVVFFCYFRCCCCCYFCCCCECNITVQTFKRYKIETKIEISLFFNPPENLEEGNVVEGINNGKGLIYW